MFITRRKSLTVHGLAEDTRPALDTPLLLPPHYNVFSNASVRLGSTQHASGHEPDDQDGYVEGFFGSAFTHVGGHMPVRAWPHSYGQFRRHVQALGASLRSTSRPRGGRSATPSASTVDDRDANRAPTA